MEVHHHSNTPVKGKHFRHYLFEFLMLFLAVSAGFFVENIREHYVEKKRAHGLAASLIKDMQKDTTQLSWLLHFNFDKESRLDSFYNLLCEPYNKIDSKTYYRLAKAIQVTYSFAPSNGTINQLKNAGYLRYFSNDSLPGFLSEYDFFFKDNEGTDQIITDLIYNKYYALLIKTSDSRLLHLEMANKEVPDSIGIISIPAEDLKSLKGIITVIHRSYASYDGVYSDLRFKAVRIMEYLYRSLHL
jgi:hypothetical protein